MARRRGQGNLNGSMKYMHYRDEGSKAVCGKTGVHTTRKIRNVTCQFCKDKLEKTSG